MRKQRNKLRQVRLLLIGGFLALSLGACTPQEAMWMNFFEGGGSLQLYNQAKEVAWCESRFDPGAVSPTNDHGLFQINARYHRTNFERVTGQPWAKVYEPYWNAYYARWLYNNQGWGPWACKKVL